MTYGMKRPVRVALVSAFWVLTVVTLAGCSFEAEEQVWEISGPIFGTRYNINVVMTDDQARLRELASGIDAALEEVDASMSTWRDDSELSRFNRLENQSQWTDISPALYEVIARGREISKMTDGAFDVTIGPVVNLWGFGPEGRPEAIPSDGELDSAMASTGYEKLQLREEPPALRAEPRQYVDLSAIAKGYGVDAVARYLASQGLSSFLVEIGGEISVQGRKPGGDAWRLAVEEPGPGERKVNRVVVIGDRAMATSGDYRNYYESEGRRFSHTIDPLDGKPIRHNLASVTVIAEDSMTADALATAFNVMGPDKAKGMATRENIAAYFIIRGEDGFKTEVSPAFSSFLTQ
jgi:thiamine biosynthesis lipoprotein